MRRATCKILGLSIALTLIGLIGASPAPPAPSEEVWSGRIEFGGGAQLRFVVHITRPKAGAITATADSPEQLATGLKVDSIAMDSKTLTFTMKKLDVAYSGKLNDAGNEAVGEFTQRGKSYPLTLRKLSPAQEQIWEGKLNLNAGLGLRLVLRTASPKDGPVRATFASPDQSPGELEVDSITLNKELLKFAIKRIDGAFSGTLSPSGSEAVGDWTQGGVARPLTLRKTDKATVSHRPQTPKPPFPYRSEQVRYENKAGGVTLAGTLTLPKGTGPFPSVLLISGSGAQDRDETILGHKPFLLLADYLTRRGIAVLRVDDRGVGGSSGDAGKATTDDFAADALSSVAFLKAHREIDGKRIGLIGHSEGGIIGPIAATRSNDVAFLVLLAGTGLPGDEILLMQTRSIAKALGSSDEETAEDLASEKQLIEVAKSENDEKVAAAKMRAIVEELKKRSSKQKRDELAKEESVLDSQLASLRSPWFRYFLTFDPRPTLTKVRCPVLVLNGEKDLQVPPKENLGEIEKALRKGGNTRVTVKEFPGLNHLFQTCRTGAPSEYATIEETMSPAVLSFIGDWIQGQVDAGGR